VNVLWTEHKTNRELPDVMNEDETLLATLQQRQKNRLGYVLRQESLL